MHAVKTSQTSVPIERAPPAIAIRDEPVSALSPDGTRLHLRHGPIDLIVSVDGSSAAVAHAFQAANAAFDGLLEQLVAELHILRSPVAAGCATPSGQVARRMHKAASQHHDRFVTPMIAVAGAVADHVLLAMTGAARLARASVNNGGDIALFLAAGATYDIGIRADIGDRGGASKITLTSQDGVGGIATSGWQGRSHSLGIADAVTVLATDAATADAAATLIANDVDLPGSPKISRQPANTLAPDSDLGPRMVTTAVGPLTAYECRRALLRGKRYARRLVDGNVIDSAILQLQGEVLIVNASTGG